MVIVARCSERSFMSAPSTAGRSSVPGLKRDFLCQSRHPVMADVSCTRPPVSLMLHLQGFR